MLLIFQWSTPAAGELSNGLLCNLTCLRKRLPQRVSFHSLALDHCVCVCVLKSREYCSWIPKYMCMQVCSLNFKLRVLFFHFCVCYSLWGVVLLICMLLLSKKLRMHIYTYICKGFITAKSRMLNLFYLPAGTIMQLLT